MGYHVVEAIIEDGQLRQVGEKLPPGTIRAHLIYDVEDNPSGQEENPDIVRATSGIYRDVDVDTEMRTLRGEWERDSERQVKGACPEGRGESGKAKRKT